MEEAATVDTALSNSQNSNRACIICCSVWGRKKEMKKKKRRKVTATLVENEAQVPNIRSENSWHALARGEVAMGRLWVSVGCEVGLREGEGELGMWTVSKESLRGGKMGELELSEGGGVMAGSGVIDSGAKKEEGNERVVEGGSDGFTSPVSMGGCTQASHT
uniref:Uncharacterized protein n=1 Tax=Oryza punctata TaxID=4537 RepID=A0A0E0LVP2_ORYPU